jgi:hypothetical protein
LRKLTSQRRWSRGKKATEEEADMDGEQKEAFLREVEEMRVAVIALVNERADELREFVETGKRPCPRERVWPLSTEPARFKGTKPVAVIFGGERVGATKWRSVYTEVLRRCDAECHDALMGLCDCVRGRKRTILGSSPNGMNVPVMVCDGLYAEADFDTGALMRVLTKLILGPAGYDFSRISVALADSTGWPDMA